MNRRGFIQSIFYTAVVAKLLASCKNVKKIPGRILGASADIGHILRDGSKTKSTSTVRKKVVIVGGGVSGLAAARQLSINGMHDFILLDLEKAVGGNATYAKNETSAYPLGAHYIPVPNNDLTEYLEFLRECNVITGFNDAGLPVYNDYFLCFDPQERLYLHGKWQEGLIPEYGVSKDDLAQTERFLKMMEVFRIQKGTDGKDAFAIPVDRSSKDEMFVALDGITMKSWMESNGFTSKYLHWYVNYCTRDDFGTPHHLASAWSGIHYFAGRKGSGANATHADVITWPQGNGYLTDALKKNFVKNIQTDSLVTEVRLQDNEVMIDYLNVNDKTLNTIVAEQCIMAVPQFIASRILKDETRKQQVKESLQYVPWMVANLQVTELKDEKGVPLSWDNVDYNSKSLGFVHSTHQMLQQKLPHRNITYYLPLTDDDCVTARRWAQQKTHEDWVELVIEDLQKIYPGIRSTIKEMNVMVWGHAMAQTLPGLIHGTARNSLSASIKGRVHFANTDIAGMSIFEEAFYQGINAAKKVTDHLANPKA